MPAPVPKWEVPAPLRVVPGEEGADADRELRVTGVGVDVPDGAAVRAAWDMFQF